MTTAQQIFERSKSLPESLQCEVLHFVEFLRTRCETVSEGQEWARFSAEQLLQQYGPMDAAYDEE